MKRPGFFELGALAAGVYALTRKSAPVPATIAPDDSQMDGYARPRRRLRGYLGDTAVAYTGPIVNEQAAPAANERFVDVPPQAASCLVVITRDTKQAFTVWPCDPGIGGSSGAASTGPLADQLRALAGTGRGAWVAGDWTADFPWRVTPSSVRPDVPTDLPSEKYGELTMNGGRLLFMVREGPDSGHGVEVKGPSVAELTKLAGTPQGGSYYLTGVWDWSGSGSVTPTAYRAGPLVTLTKEETGRAADMVVTPTVADASRAAVADGRGSFIPQKAEDGYYLPDGTHDVPLAIQGGGVTVTGAVHPDILTQTPLLVSVLKETAARTGTTIEDQFNKVSDQLLHMNPDSAELQDYLQNDLAPAAGVSTSKVPPAALAAGFGALLLFGIPALAKGRR